MRIFMIAAALAGTLFTVGAANAEPYRGHAPAQSNVTRYGDPNVVVAAPGSFAPRPQVYGRAPQYGRYEYGRAPQYGRYEYGRYARGRYDRPVRAFWPEERRRHEREWDRDRW